MGFLQAGIWHGADQDQIGAKGWEPRIEQFKGLVTAGVPENEGDFLAESGRYHLIVCPGCPLSHRTLILHRLKGLEGIVSVSSVRPIMGENGREFGTAEAIAPDPVTGASFLHELYLGTDPAFTGRDATPVLWDRKTGKIVSNTYRDIFSMLNRAFDAFTDTRVDLQPAEQSKAIEDELARLSSGILGVVYRCGFSRSQTDYEAHATTLGETVRRLAADLDDRPFLLGDTITEPDIALFVCLVRYDAIYVPLFRCTRERVEDHPALSRYITRIMQLPGVRETFDLKLTMTHYFASHAHINPTRIVPLPPQLSWWTP
ncbi:MAG: glutathione S-transferase family protein [Hyphomicrobiales bacterium]|nr:MAG: glutathione S-transferase family protein [Hyphomicrobiales bacterium]